VSDNKQIVGTAACPFYVTKRTKKEGKTLICVSNQPPQFGVFFDGTGNNLYNDSQSWTDDNEPTNIAKLYALYPRSGADFVNSFYIDGIGTSPGNQNSNIDMAIAHTFDNRLSESMSATLDFFERFPNAPIGILDVFGFSRGAAMARAFVNEVHKINKTDPQYWGGAELVVRFLGLFDTVGSVGMPGDNHNAPYILDLSPRAASYVFHLTAQHEQREYFPLSSILTDTKQAPAAHFKEVEIPGAHSDVGGGYGPVAQTIHFPSESFYWMMTKEREPKLLEIKKTIKTELERKYPLPGIDITFTAQDLTQDDIGELHTQTIVSPRWIRSVNPALAHNALQKMHANAIDNGVPLEPLTKLPESVVFGTTARTAEQLYEVPVDLKTYLSRLEVNPNDKEASDFIYTKYVHHSHQYASTPEQFMNANKPEKNPNRAAPNGKREIFYNHITRGYSHEDKWKQIRILKSSFPRRKWVRQANE